MLPGGNTSSFNYLAVDKQRVVEFLISPAIGGGNKFTLTLFAYTPTILGHNRNFSSLHFVFNNVDSFPSTGML